MINHQALHLAVVAPAPVRASQEGVANHHLIARNSMVPRCPDDLLFSSSDHRQRAAGLEGFVEEYLESGWMGPGGIGVLCPDQRIGRDPIKAVVICCCQGSQAKQ